MQRCACLGKILRVEPKQVLAAVFRGAVLRTRRILQGRELLKGNQSKRIRKRSSGCCQPNKKKKQLDVFFFLLVIKTTMLPCALRTSICHHSDSAHLLLACGIVRMHAVGKLEHVKDEQLKLHASHLCWVAMVIDARDVLFGNVVRQRVLRRW